MRLQAINQTIFMRSTIVRFYTVLEGVHPITCNIYKNINHYFIIIYYFIIVLGFVDPGEAAWQPKIRWRKMVPHSKYR